MVRDRGEGILREEKKLNCEEGKKKRTQ